MHTYYKFTKLTQYLLSNGKYNKFTMQNWYDLLSEYFDIIVEEDNKSQSDCIMSDSVNVAFEGFYIVYDKTRLAKFVLFEPEVDLKILCNIGCEDIILSYDEVEEIIKLPMSDWPVENQQAYRSKLEVLSKLPRGKYIKYATKEYLSTGFNGKMITVSSVENNTIVFKVIKVNNHLLNAESDDGISQSQYMKILMTLQYNMLASSFGV